MIKYGMLNWTDDVPYGSRQCFLSALDEIERGSKQMRILEIGTFTGSSIAFLHALHQDAHCVAIDNWKLCDEELKMCHKIAGEEFTMTDVRNAFFKNTSNKVTIIEEHSHLALANMIDTNTEKFNLIYVDGSHEATDALTDILYAWILLEKGGVLAIDDYMFIPPNFSESRPKHAVDYFLKKFAGQYKLVSKGYRVFVKKLF